ncbi:fumarylacetoacetate hydrolase family protein [Budvicia diplopodorum]|uniref:fumarylacetoacetate hydrolase family protein n=1 Tax=Budvicia diplopodorum TaxID=1119056 RepID=UPI00135C8A71|nr:fumarylacetoacetate hydrolase family protein [Budvicia diplopodorum]
MYQHRDWQGDLLELPVGKVVCIGKNYSDHIKEMGDNAPKQPLLFIKPETALCDIKQPIAIPDGFGSVHYEVELAVLIGLPLKNADEARVANAIVGYGIAIDLTLRDLQSELKKAGEPWEKAKAFDASCPISGFIPAGQFGDAQQASLSLSINGEMRQRGNTKDMITPILPLIAYMSRFFTLRPGDIIITGTPSGVGAIEHGDSFSVSLNGKEIASRVL